MTMDITIREAVPHHAAALSAIALQAKGYWGYSDEQLTRWRQTFLTISAAYIQATASGWPRWIRNNSWDSLLSSSMVRKLYLNICGSCQRIWGEALGNVCFSMSRRLFYTSFSRPIRTPTLFTAS
jgi:hypothetical protein